MHLKRQSPFHPQAWHQDQCFPAQQDWYVNLDVTKTTYKCVWSWQISLIFDSTWLSTLKAMGTQLWPKIEFRWSDKRPPLHTICFVDVMIYRHRACQLPLPPFNCYPKSKDRSTCSQKGARSSPSEGQHWQQIGAEAAKNISTFNWLFFSKLWFLNLNLTFIFAPSDSHSIFSICHWDGWVMSNPGKPVPLMGEAHPMHPPTSHRGVRELGHQLPDRHLLSPRGLAGPLLDILDESGEHSDLEISWSAR